MKIIVLGGGLVGGPTAADLASAAGFEVTVADVDAARLDIIAHRFGLATIQKDLSDPEDVKELVSGYDLVLSAVPGRMGFRTLQAVVEAGKNVVDIAFFPENPFELDEPARRNRVTAVVDCGVAPGMSNLLTGHVQSLLDEVHSVLIYVGGLPETREWPFEYKAGFSPADVIEEYLRPARFVQNGAVVVRPALSDPELLNFPGIGTLEAFDTDGLRTLIRTVAAPDMKEKTLRYPGHVEKILLLRRSGFFSNEEIDVGGARVRPVDLTAKLLFPMWQLKEADRDLTVMKVVVEGVGAGIRRRYTYDLLDRFDPVSGVHSMARTTGYTAAGVMHLLAQGKVEGPGIVAPEFLGNHPECVQFLLEYLEERGIRYRETQRDLDIA